MWKQTLCVTLPISAAVVIAAGLFANAGDLNPPPGEIGSTMHTLEEIYHAVAEPQSCPPCVWDYWYGSLGSGDNLQVATGSGVLHGIWITRSNTITIHLHDRLLPEDGLQIGRLERDQAGGGSSQFFELNVPFETGLTVQATSAGTSVTVLYQLNQ